MQQHARMLATLLFIPMCALFLFRRILSNKKSASARHSANTQTWNARISYVAFRYDAIHSFFTISKFKERFKSRIKLQPCVVCCVCACTLAALWCLCQLDLLMWNGVNKQATSWCLFSPFNVFVRFGGATFLNITECFSNSWCWNKSSAGTFFF